MMRLSRFKTLLSGSSVMIVTTGAVATGAGLARATEYLPPRTHIHEATREVEHVDHRTFCSKTTEKEAASRCDTWLQEQKKSLGSRLLTSHCGDGEQTADASCLFRADGDVKYTTTEKKVIYDE